MLNPTLHKFDYVEKVKLRVGDLRVGMYVCELDRPWLETPFTLQGIEIKNESDIETIRRHCDFVYIDLARTRLVRIDVGAVPVKSYTNKSRLVTLERELETASSARENTAGLVKTFIQEVQFGNSVDIQLAKAAVSECVASVMRNADAMMFMTQLRSKNEYVSEHAFNVCIYAIVIGRLAGLATWELENLGTCALLHDMGTVRIPDLVLNKPGKLNGEEFDIVKMHPIWGRDILMSGRNLFTGTVDVAYAHHETLNGTGYPRGLQGAQINRNSKIVAIADKYDAIVSARPYRKARDHLNAIGVLNKMAAASQLDGELTTGFVSYLGIYPPGTLVELSSGEVAIVLETNPGNRLKPQLLVIRDAFLQPVEKFVDMSEVATGDGDRQYRITKVWQPEEIGVELARYKDAIVRALG
jgi:HD-GYP domain-containing protein (c-di-GMP phosphodiesterase class II)